MRYIDGKKITVYQGDHKPVERRRNNIHIAGWVSSTKSGATPLQFDNCYNDIADVTVEGNTVQASDYYAKDGLSSQAGTPSPEAPIPITSNLPAGTYKYTSTDGIYEFTLPADLHGIGTDVDKITFDRVSHRGGIEIRVGKTLFNGVASPSGVGINTNTLSVSFNHNAIPIKVAGEANASNTKNTHLPFQYSTNDIEHFYLGPTAFFLFLNKSRFATFDNAGVSSYLSLNNITIMYLIKPTYAPLTFTKVSSSNATEVPMTFLTNTPQLNYPADVNSVTGNVKSRNADSSKQSTAPLPELKAIGTVKDTYNPKTGRFDKRISDWFLLGGDRNWLNTTYTVPTFKRVNCGDFFPSNYSGLTKIKAQKFDSTLLTNNGLGSESTSNGDGINAAGGDTGLRISIFNTDSGWSGSWQPSNAEIKAYFWGWKMCNADGTSPYYKSEVPYTPSTWAEWNIQSGIIANSSGIKFTKNGGHYYNAAYNNCTFKTATKYGFLYEVTSSNVVNGSIYRNSNAFGWGQFPIVVGKNKLVLTSWGTITTNKIDFVFDGSLSNAEGTSITIKDIRIFELPAGSQIESDFNTITADQLAAKYTFNGLCVKNWKKVTDGTGQTAVLPTASYAGYTPYKMCYELATPEVVQYTPNPLATYYETTFVEVVGSAVPANINATVKVPE